MGQVGHAQNGRGAIGTLPLPWFLTVLVRAACRSIAYAANFGAVIEGGDGLDAWLGVGLPLPVVQVGKGVRVTAPATQL
jgi:hypothetical protein